MSLLTLSLPTPPLDFSESHIVVKLGGYFAQKRVESAGRAFTKRARNIARGRSASHDETDDAATRAYDSQCDFDEWIPSGTEKIAENDSKGEGKSFYELYGPVFTANARFSANQPVPTLGGDDKPIDEVYAFYDFWNKFDSWRDFTHDSEHDVESAEHRDHKRWMAKKNEAVAKKKKKKEYARLASLVDRALAVDPRIRRVKQEEKDRKAQAKREKEEAAQRLINEENRKKQEQERAVQEAEEKQKEARKDAKMAKEKQKKLFRKVKKAFRELMVAASDQGLDGAIDVIKTEDLCDSLNMDALEALVTACGGSADKLDASGLAAVNDALAKL
ncbi:unnamed protein product [Peronospora destructor]|uniref:Zuotin-like zuotin homology domain-containing protein n=1 Tax=Peronospora destructor TaxID=86335 RepID=A0AAV0T8J8_9STRA|nr:unnamed protein product [Peronospora destructor]